MRFGKYLKKKDSKIATDCATSLNKNLKEVKKKSKGMESKRLRVNITCTTIVKN
jgi:hypothetical protein